MHCVPATQDAALDVIHREIGNYVLASTASS